ncbi:MAG: DEAD/DEAH box helicase [Acidimicrobiales bacterium]
MIATTTAPAAGPSTARGEGDGTLAGFHPAVATWFARRFPEGPTLAQSLGWAQVNQAHDTLISAPTGSGKTLAGFLVAIDACYRAHEAGEDIGDRARVVYISPLKALAVDIAENLQRPLAEIAAVAVELGGQPAPIRVGVRTGDTSSSQRAVMVRRPPSFVVTTPESFYLLLTSERGRQALRTVDTVIVDEIHAVARDKRGAHLALSLERLEALCDRRPVRIGLSATQRPIEVVGHLLVGARPLPAIVDVGHQRNLDLGLELPDGELEAVASAEQMGDVLDRIAALVGEHRTTLVFVNTRRLAERLAHDLGSRLGDDVVAAHHGSLSKDRRHRVEARLRAGELRALVATASLELGIDIGPVELVCQIGSPRSIATFLQRVGRSNHSRAGTPKGRIFPMTRDELVECTALLVAVRSGRLDAIVPSRQPMDIAAQQIVAEVAAREWTTEGLHALVRRAAPFEDLDRVGFDRVLDLVSNGIETGRGRRGAYLHHDPVNGEVRARKGARLAAATSGGAIPETGDYRVVAEPDDTFVGTVNEDWAVESMAGDIFLLGTASWQIRRVEPGVVRVRDAGDSPPTVPFWLGEAPARTAELSQEVSELRRRVDCCLAKGEPDQARAWLCDAAGIPVDASAMIVDYLAAGRAVLGVMPTQGDLVLERFFDDTGGMQLVLHAPFGARVNRGLGLALRKKFCRSFNFELQAAATDDAVVLSLGPHHSFPLEEVPRYLSAATVTDTLEHAILDSPMFQARWRWNLNRSLIVLRFRNGRRNPPPIQRMEADDLMAAVFPQAAACQENITGPIEIPDHLLVRQTIDDTLHEALDVDGLRALLERIERGEVRVHFCESTEPSVLAHEIVSARPYAFLDDEETQNRRVNAVHLRRGIPVELSTIGALDPAAIERVHAEIGPEPQTPDDLHDLISSTLLLRARDAWRPLWDQLVERGRGAVLDHAVFDHGVLDHGGADHAVRDHAVRDHGGADHGGADHGGAELWSTTEQRAEAEAALAGEDGGVVRALRGHLELSGITTTAELCALTALAPGRVDYGLAVLQRDGFAMQGLYRPGATGTEWVARRLLARMHSYSKRSRRTSVDPASAQDFMRFLLRWQHLAPGSQLAGPAGLTHVLGQLQGFQAAAGAWERDLIAPRLAHYQPSWLDSMCHAGEVAWLRLARRAHDDPEPSSASPSKATPIAVVLRADLGWLLGAGRGEQVPSLPGVGATAEVVEVLRDRGASFAGDLAAATRRLPDDIERALWDGVARGLVMCDGFSAIRSKVAGPPPGSRPGRLSRVRRGAGPSPAWATPAWATAASAGRWALVPSADGHRQEGPAQGQPGPRQAPLVDSSTPGLPSGQVEPGTQSRPPGEPVDRHELAEAVAEQLLSRWGVLFRDLALRDDLRLAWREVQQALRRLEDRGLILGGRFVSGFGGEQYALPEAAELLARARQAPRTGERVVVNATDPLNLVGTIVPGATVPAVRTNRVTYLDGIPEARGST